MNILKTFDKTTLNFLNEYYLLFNSFKNINLDKNSHEIVNDNMEEIYEDDFFNVDLKNYLENENLNDFYLKDKTTSRRILKQNFLINKFLVWQYCYIKYLNSKLIKEKLNEIKNIYQTSNLEELPEYDSINSHKVITDHKNNNSIKKKNNEITIDTLERWPLCVICIGGMACMGLSSLFHLMCSYSNSVKCFLNRLDYVGIVILVVFSCYPPYYYWFYCNFGKEIYDFQFL